MKFTRTESGVVDVKGCTSCPHMNAASTDGWTHMYCTHPIPKRPKSRKLVGRWAGPYHESCPLPSEAKNVPEEPKKDKQPF